MSKTVDERVLEMRFDNQQFERNVQTSMNTLDKLKSSLNLSGATKGFSNIDNAVKGLKFEGLSSAVETVKTKFTSLEVVAITALANITNSAVNAGKRIVQSLTIEPVMQGFAEYELKMGSIQTIMASTGESLDTVNGYLDELNTYADKTIYSFSDMTSNIGKFTNSGVKLEDAVKAIQGISNEAAISGANTNEASRAMYNFAQALSAGYVKLIDWKSIENANMATVEFKQQLLDTAVAMGTVVKVGEDYQSVTTDNNGKVSSLFNATKNFNDALSSQWMTTDVLVQTLGNYSTDVRNMSKEEKKAYEEKLKAVGYTEEQIKSIEELGKKAFDSAQDVKTFTQLMGTLKEAAGSGWAKTFEILIGDFNEAKTLWTGISKVVGGFIDAQSDARNKLLEEWSELGGRTALFDSFKNIFNGLVSVLTPIRKAFRDIFPAITAERLAEITEKIKDLTSKFTISNRTASFLRLTFRGLFSIINIGKQFVVALAKQLAPLTKYAGTFGKRIVELTGAFGKWLTGLDKAIAKNDTFTKAFEKIKAVIIEAIQTIIPIFEAARDKAVEIYDKLSTAIEKVAEVLSNVQDRFSGAIDAIKEFKKTKIVPPKTEGLMSFSEKIKARLEPIKRICEIIASVFRIIGNVIAAVFNKIKPILIRLGDIVLNTLSDIWNGLTQAFYGEGFDSLLDILNGGLMAGIGVGIVKFIKSITGIFDTINGELKGKNSFVESIKNIFSGVGEAINAFTASIKADILKKIAISIAVLAASLIALSLVDSNKLTIAIAAVTSMFVELAAMMKFMSGNLITGSSLAVSSAGNTMIKLAAAIAIISIALAKIGSMKPKELAVALTGMTGIMAGIAGFAYTWNRLDIKFSKSQGLAMIELGAAMVILAKSLQIIAGLSWSELARALTGMAATMTILTISLNKLNSEGAMKKSSSFILISAGLLILGEALKKLSSMSWEEIAKSFVALAGSMTILVIALNKLNADGVVKSSFAMLIMATSLTILGEAMKIMASMSWEEIGKALASLAGSMTILIIALNKIKKDGVVKSAFAMVLMATSLTILGGAMKMMSGLSLAQIGKSLLAIAGSLAIIVIAFNSFKYSDTLKTASALLVMSIALNGLGSALKIMGSMSLSEIGKSLLLLSGAFVVLGIAGRLLKPVVLTLMGLGLAVALVGAGIAALGVGILSLAVGLSILSASAVLNASTMVAAFQILFVGLLNVLIDSAETIARAIKALILAALDVFVECIPAIVDGALQLIIEVVNSLVEFIPTIVTLLVDLIIKLINALSEKLPELIDAGFGFVKKLVQGIVDGLNQFDTSALAEGVKWAAILGGLMIELAIAGAVAASAMTGVLAMAAVLGELTLLLIAAGALSQIPGVDWLIGEGSEVLSKIAYAIGGFVGNLIGGLAEGVTNGFPQIGQNLSDFMTNAQGFITGASNIPAGAFEGIKALADTILVLTATEILDGLTSWFTGGKSSLTDFASELSSFAPEFISFANTISGANIDTGAVESSANALKIMAEAADAIGNKGGLLADLVGENSLAEFAEELKAFAPAIVYYSAMVDGRVNESAVTASANALKIMAEAAGAIENQGGLLADLVGENSLATFAEELKAFGPAIVYYSKTVEGNVSEEAVTASANALKIMAEAAGTIENQGGIWADIFGDNSLSMFAEELKEFAPAIVYYSKMVDGNISSTAVEASANAMSILIEMSKEIPNSGGLVSLFTGDNDIATFGTQLESFGASLVTYSSSLTNVDMTALSTATTAITELINLANGIASVDMSNLSMFASNMKTYAINGLNGFLEAFTDTNASTLVSSSIATLVTKATTAMTTHAVELKTAGKTAGEGAASGIEEGISGKKQDAIASVSSVCMGIIEKVRDTLLKKIFTTYGSNNVGQGLIDGITDKQSTVIKTVGDLCLAIMNKVNTTLSVSSFKNYGLRVVTGLKQGIGDTAAVTSLKAAANRLCANVRNALNSSLTISAFKPYGARVVSGVSSGLGDSSAIATLKARADSMVSIVKNAFTRGGQNYFYSEMYKIGQNAAQGLLNGLGSKEAMLRMLAQRLAQDVLDASRKKFDERSPSHEMYAIGAYATLGLINGFISLRDKLMSSVDDTAGSVINPIKSAISAVVDLINNGIDSEPTIRPVMDLTDIQNGVGTINGMFSKGINLSNPYGRALRAGLTNDDLFAESAKEASVTNYNYTQNNYSPKALSRSEIYRQTKNQFAAMKGAVGRA